MIIFGADKLLNYLQTTLPEEQKGVDQRIFTFDIEQSNGYIIDGVARPFDYSLPPAFYNSKEKAVICYLWQFGINDIYFYGRDIHDLIPVCKFLAGQDYISIVWVHNLSYEFATLIGMIQFNKVFARSTHKPIKAEYGNLQFRCTFQLSHQSLKSIGANVGFPKLTEQFEYDSIRVPTTKIKLEEVEYAIRDLEILTAYIRKMVSEYKLLQRIPLTQTGRVRQDIRDIYHKDWKYHQKMTKMLPKDAAEYARMKAAFVGGWVHANYYYVNVLLKNAVVPWDITSSYPTQLIRHKNYAQTPFTECVDPEDFDFYLNNEHFVCLVQIDCVNIRTRRGYYNDYLSESKTEEDSAWGVKAENGRIYEAFYFRMMTTSIDLEIIRDSYEVIPGKKGGIMVRRLWYARAGYLDKRYVMYILKLYNNKVTLTNTGDPVKEELRARSKELLNSLYGLMVSSLVYPEIRFDSKRNEWIPPRWESNDEIADFTNSQLDQLREKGWKNFQCFFNGLVCTANARRQLYDAISHINKDVVYNDTDSVYCVGDHSEFFNQYNADLKQELLDIAENRNIDPELLHPKDPNGNDQWIGMYISDTGGFPFAEFKTLGAKRYAYRETPDSGIKITIAGVNKKSGAKALDNDINNLKDDMEFDYRDCGRLISHYLTDMQDVVWEDRDGNRYVSKQTCGVCLQPTRYQLGMGEFLDVLVSLGSLSDQYSELDISDLMQIGEV